MPSSPPFAGVLLSSTDTALFSTSVPSSSSFLTPLDVASSVPVIRDESDVAAMLESLKNLPPDQHARFVFQAYGLSKLATTQPLFSSPTNASRKSPKKTAEELQTQETDFETIISPVLEWLTEYLILSRLEGNDAAVEEERARVAKVMDSGVEELWLSVLQWRRKMREAFIETGCAPSRSVQLDYVTALESFIHTCEEILVVVSELNDSINERLEPWSNLLNLCGSIEELLDTDVNYVPGMVTDLSWVTTDVLKGFGLEGLDQIIVRNDGCRLLSGTMGGVAWQALNNLRQCPSSSRQNVILMEKFDQRYHALLQIAKRALSNVRGGSGKWMAEVERLELREAEFQEGAVDREKQVRRTEFFQRFLHLQGLEVTRSAMKKDLMETMRAWNALRDERCKALIEIAQVARDGALDILADRSVFAGVMSVAEVLCRDSFLKHAVLLNYRLWERVHSAASVPLRIPELPCGVELQRRLDDYELVSVLREGKVYHVKYANEHLCLRAYPSSSRAQVAQEITCVDRMQSAGISVVPILGYFFEGPVLYLVSPYFRSGSLASWLAKLSSRDDPTVSIRILNVFRDLCWSLARLHDLGIVHRSLQLSHLFVGENERGVIGHTQSIVSLADASTFSDEQQPLAYHFPRRAYRAPELASATLMTPPSRAADVFAVGVCLAQAFLGSHFDASKVYQLPPELPLPLFSLLRSMLADDAVSRPTFREVLTYDVFNWCELDNSVGSVRRLRQLFATLDDALSRVERSNEPSSLVFPSGSLNVLHIAKQAASLSPSALFSERLWKLPGSLEICSQYECFVAFFRALCRSPFVLKSAVDPPTYIPTPLEAVVRERPFEDDGMDAVAYGALWTGIGRLMLASMVAYRTSHLPLHPAVFDAVFGWCPRLGNDSADTDARWMNQPGDRRRHVLTSMLGYLDAWDPFLAEKYRWCLSQRAPAELLSSFPCANIQGQSIDNTTTAGAEMCVALSVYETLIGGASRWHAYTALRNGLSVDGGVARSLECLGNGRHIQYALCISGQQHHSRTFEPAQLVDRLVFLTQETSPPHLQQWFEEFVYEADSLVLRYLVRFATGQFLLPQEEDEDEHVGPEEGEGEDAEVDVLLDDSGGRWSLPSSIPAYSYVVLPAFDSRDALTDRLIEAAFLTPTVAEM